MSVARDDVRRVAQLARIDLDEKTTARLVEELNGILSHVESLSEVQLDDPESVDGEQEDAGGSGFRDPELRPDLTDPGVVAQGAPGWRDGFFLVPRLPALIDEDGAAGPTLPEDGGP